MSHDATGRLLDIQTALSKIHRFCREKSRADLDKDEMLALSVIRLLEITGEAIKNLPEEIKRKYPGVPWGEFARLRDKLIHGYFSVDYDIIWNIVSKEVPYILHLISGESNAGA